MINRRDFLGTTLGAGAALAFTPELLRALAQSGGTLIHRAIPSTGEKIPIIGVQFRNNTSQDPAALKDVLKTLTDNGGKFLDTMHQSVPGVEDLTATCVTERSGFRTSSSWGCGRCLPARRRPAPRPRK